MQGALSGPMSAPGRDAAAAARAGRLLARLQAEPLEGYEKSFKMSAGRLLGNRFLVGIPAAQMAAPKLFAICDELEMPGDFLLRLQNELGGADTIHFGFEESQGSGLFKLYLEYWNRLNRARAAGAESVLLHRAFKWDALDRSRRTVADYRCFLRLSREQTLQRIAAIYRDDAHPAFGLARQLVSLAAARTSEKLMYLEVSEEGNPRASFDLNFHAAEFKLRELEMQLTAMSRHYALPAEQFAALWRGIAERTLGHLSGGLSRDGRDFMTIYYDPRG